MKTCKFFNIVMAFVLAFSFLGIPAPVSGQEHSPSIQVWISGRVDGLNWPENNQITLRIENPSLPESPTFNATLPTFPCWWDGNQGCVNIDMGSFQFVVGQVMTMSDQNDNVREYTITSLSLKITEIDPGTDTISGIADPNSSLSVNIGNILNAPNRIVTADTFGRWTAYFSDVGTGEPTFDITPGTGIWVSQQDNDGDGISDYAMVPALMVKANFDTDEIQAWGLENGTPISLSINDPDNGPGVDYSEILNIAPTDWDPNQYLAQFRPENFDVQPGQIITVSGGGQIKTMTVANIWGISIDVDADTVSGYIAAGSSARVHVGENLDSGNLFVDENGYWIADLSLVGTDIKPGSKGYVQVDTQDGGTTWIGFQVFNPSFTALFPWNRIDAYRWPMDADLALTIDDPDNGTGADYTETTTVGLENFNPPSDTWASFRVDGFELQPGQLITVTDGETIKTHVVQYVTVTEVNPETDTIVGTATPGTEVQIGRMCDESGCAYRSIVANAEGNWLADLTSIGNVGGTQGVFDIGPGSKSDAFIADDNDDRTSYQWEVPSIPNPAFSVVPNDPNSGPRNIIMGWDWEAGTTVTLCIENPPFDLACDYTDSLIVPTEPNGFAGSQFQFSVDPSIFRITAGQRVQLDNGLHTEQHIVTNMRLLWVDWDTDTVGGTADPDSVIGVPAVGDNQYVNRRVIADGQGLWSADYAHPGGAEDEQDTLDLRQGHHFFIPEQWDENGNSTKFWWQPPNPPTIAARPGEQQISGYDWPEGATINLMVDDPSTSQSPDYIDSLTADMQDWGQTEAYFDLRGKFYFGAGYIITMTDGTTAKTHTVTNLDVKEVDADHDLVYGVADPGDNLHIFVWIPWPDSYAWRDIVADANGEWVADFSIPVDGMTYDITDGAFGEVLERDEDEDFTNIYWYWPMAAKYCVPGDTISGTVYQANGVTPVAYANLEIQDYSTGAPRFVTATDQNGQYACYLPNGDYRIKASADNYTQEYYNEAHDTNAGLIQVTAGTQLIGINFTISPMPASEHFTFNMDNLLLQDSTVRRAIAFGTDRQRILNQAFLPNSIYGMVSNSIVPIEHWASAPSSELTLYTFNPVQARSILEAAGWIDRDNDGFRENAQGIELAFTFKTTAAAIRVASAQIFRENMEQIGIRITVENIPAGEFFAEGGLLSQGNFDIVEFAWGGGYDDELPMGAYVTDNFQNYSSYSNPSFDAAMSNAVAASSDAQRLPYLIEAQLILTQDLPIFPLFTRYNVKPVETLAGDGVTVSLEDNLTIHFESVTEPGVTGVITSAVSPLQLPPNFQLLGKVYDIGTSAQFTSAQACFTYDDASLTPSQESAIRLFHLEDNVWVNVTDSGYPDMVNNIVCGIVSSFSPFAIIYRLNQPPHADLGPDLVTDEGSALTLDASASSDPEAGALTYEWDLDNDGLYDDASGVTPNIIFPDNGTYIVGLKVTDPMELNSTDTMQVIVSNVIPTAMIQQSSANNLGTFTGSGSFADPGADTWTATVNYGDNTSTRNLTLNSDKTFTLNHTYAHNGIYTAKVCVTDDDGGESCAQTQIKVSINHPPVAEADGPYSGNEGSSITLNASHSTDPDRNIVSYEWDLDNDGLFDDATGVRPKFTAIDNGVFTVRVRVTDAGGLSNIDSTTVNVKNVSPVVTSLSFNNSIRVGIPVIALAKFKDAGINDTFTSVWNWGDGTTSIGTVSSYKSSGSHTYTKPGVYIVTITVTDKDGGTGQFYKLIIVLSKK